MTVHSIPDGAIAVHDKTLAAATVDVVNFAHDPDIVEIISDGAAKIFVSIDGTTPTVGGAHTYLLPALPCKRTIRHGGDKAVRLISAGTPTYSVTVI